MSIQQKAPPTVMGRLVVCVASFWGAIVLYERSMAGADVAGLGDVGGFAAVALALVGLNAAIGFLNAVDNVIDRHRWHRRLEAASDRQGTAKLGDLKTAKAGGFLTGFGFICGRLKGKLFTIESQKSWIVHGPAGSGKSLWLLVNLLASRHAKSPGKSYWSWFNRSATRRVILPGLMVLDVTGEIFCVVRRRLLELGYRIVVLCPEAERMSAELGVEFESTPCNPAEFLRNSGNRKDDAEMFTQFLHPGTPKGKGSPSSEHFDELGRMILTMWVLWLMFRYGEVTLPSLRRVIMATGDEQAAAIEEMLKVGDKVGGGALRETAAAVQNLMVNSPEEFSGAMTTATRAVRLYSQDSPIGSQVSEHFADWGDLKNPETPTVFFIMTPPERLDTYAPWVSLTIATGVETMARHRNHNPVHIHLDEVGNIFLPNLSRLISVYRKFGLVTILYLQSMRAQLSRWYGSDAATEIITNCETLQGFSMRSLSDLREISALAGEETVTDGSATLREGPGGVPEVSFSGQYRGRPLCRIEDIRQLPADKTLLLHANYPPFILDVVNPLKEPWLRKMSDDNPYYRED